MSRNRMLQRFVTTIYLSTLVLLASCIPEKPRLEIAREIVTLGTTRERAIELLAPDAWYHQQCFGRTDLFFYGSHDYDEAEIVIVNSLPDDGGYKVYQVANFESYAWHTAYQNCIDGSRFDNYVTPMYRTR